MVLSFRCAILLLTLDLREGQMDDAALPRHKTLHENSFVV
jgi:hypothetical protein